MIALLVLAISGVVVPLLVKMALRERHNKQAIALLDKWEIPYNAAEDEESKALRREHERELREFDEALGVAPAEPGYFKNDRGAIFEMRTPFDSALARGLANSSAQQLNQQQAFYRAQADMYNAQQQNNDAFWRAAQQQANRQH